MAESTIRDRQLKTPWRAAAITALVLLILILPLARHWILLKRPPFDVYYEFTSTIFYLSDAATLLLLAASALWLWREKPSTEWGAAVVTLPLMLLPVLALGTTPWAGDPELAAYFAGRLVALSAVYLAIVALRPPRWAVQFGLATSAILQAAVAVAQFIIQDDLGWQWLGEIKLSPTPGLASILTAGDEVWLRGYGLTPHPNILGGVLMVMLLTLSISYLKSRGRWRAVWLAILMIGGVGLVVSFSRAAWLGGAAGGMVLLLGVLGRRPWRQQYARAILVPIIVGLLVLSGFAFARRDLFIARLRPPETYTASRSLDERRVLADVSLDLIRRFPATGIGAGNFSTAVAPLVEDAPATTPQPVHNLPLLVSAELGVAGGALWMWLMVAPPILAWRQFRAGRLSLWALGLTAGLVALATIDLFDFYSWGWPQGRLLRWTYLGLWSSTLSDSAT